MKAQPRTIVEAVRIYFAEPFLDEMGSFRRLVRYYLVVLVGLSVLLAALVVYVRPYPLRAARFMTDRSEFSYFMRPTVFQNYFQANGLELTIGEVENLRAGVRILNHDDGAGATFAVAGTLSDVTASTVLSLGAVEFAPFWLLVRKDGQPSPTMEQVLGTKRISIGATDSTARILFDRFFRQLNPKDDNLVYAAPQEAIRKLQKGEIDGIFLVDTIASPYVQTLLADETLELVDFDLADAFVETFPVLRKIGMPRGAISLAPVRPENARTLLGATLELLVDKDLHPAYQWAFLLATKDYRSQTEGFFTPPDYFPTKANSNVRLSEIAQNYYDNNLPALFGRLPIWLASSINEAWVYVLALFLLGSPLVSFVTMLREQNSRWALNRLFRQLRRLETGMLLASSRSELLPYKVAIENLRAEAVRRWVDPSVWADYYQLRGSIELADEIYQAAEERLRDDKPITRAEAA